MKRTLDEQIRQLSELKRSLAAQEASLEAMRRMLQTELQSAERENGLPLPGLAPVSSQAAVRPDHESPPPDREVSTAPAVAPIFEQPGVLTPVGKSSFEPSIQYAYSSSNRIALVGYTVIPAILVGLIDVREVKRTTFTGAVTFRHGLTNRLEVEAKLPYVYRSDTSVGREVLQGSNGDSSAVFDANGQGIGDAEFTARYQLNSGAVDRAFYVASMRFKTRTGKDQFQVPISNSVSGFGNDYVETELPTGSGFYGLQPALTVLFPSDPTVFFGSLSYLHSFARDKLMRQTDQGTVELGRISPGGVFGFNFGMGLALNEKSSFSIGYDHSSVGKTQQNGKVAADSVQLQLATLLLGYSFRLDDRRTLNLSLGAGLTRDTPDVALTLRMPTAF